MVGYLVGRFGLFGMARLEGDVFVCAPWHLPGLACAGCVTLRFNRSSPYMHTQFILMIDFLLHLFIQDYWGHTPG